MNTNIEFIFQNPYRLKYNFLSGFSFFHFLEMPVFRTDFFNER